MSVRHWCGAVLLIARLLGNGSAAAQGPASAAAISGMVEDRTGGAIAGATIMVRSQDTGQQWSATSDGRGRYRVLALPPGIYDVEAIAPGFSAETRVISLALGQVLDVAFQLTLATLSESVRVSAALDVVDVSRTQTSESVTPREIQQLPLNGRNYLDLALLTPGVSRTNTGSMQRFAETSAVPGTGLSISGQRNLNNTFVVDGVSANDDAAGLAGTFFSQEVIREFEVISSGSVAEFGRASSGVVNMVTQSGTDEYRAASYVYVRDDGLDARNPLASRQDPLSQQQFGATFGGPLRRQRTFLFSNAERTRNRGAGQITMTAAAAAAIDGVLARTAPSLRPVDTGAYESTFDTLNLFARMDHQYSPGTRFALRYSLYDLGSVNARNVGGLSAVSRGTALDNRDQTVALAAFAASQSGVLNEVHVQATHSRLAAPPNDPRGPAVNISGVAAFGTATVSPTARSLDVLQAIDTVTVARGTHLFKAGADLLYNRVAIEFPGAVQGVYTFGSLSDFERGRYITFQQAFGAAGQVQSNPNLGLFVQSEWRPRDSLTLTSGLRYDLQWLPDPIATDVDNVSPRAGLAWAPGDRKTVVRANAGVYFDRVPLRATSNALQRDGRRYSVAVLRFDDPGAPHFPAVLDAFPAGLLTSITAIDPHVEAASSRQVAISVERQLGARSSLTAGYQHTTGTGLLMSRNVNAPPARPDPRYLNVLRYESIGRSRYDGLFMSGRAAGKHVEARAAYTFSRALDDAGNFFFSQPQDSTDVRADWGPSDNDQRRRLVVSGSWHAAGWQVAGLLSYASALPFNVQTGTDRNQDTTVNDRPEGIGRNSARGFDFAALDVRLGRVVAVGRARVELTVDGFNLLNRPNFTLPNNIYGTADVPRPSFGQATAALDARQVQLGARILF